VSAILAANDPTTAPTTFIISGPGFGATGANAPVTVTVNLTGVGDPTSLVAAINAGIASAAAGGTANDHALAAANIQASIHTGTDGHQQLVFTSPNSAFNVAAGDATANALMGNMTGNTGGTDTNTDEIGQAVNTGGATFVAAGTQQTAALAFTNPMIAGDTQTLAFTANNAAGVPQTRSITLAGANTAAQAAAAINTSLQATDNPALQSIVASVDATGTSITFSSNSPSTFNVTIGEQANAGVVGTDGFVATDATATSSVVGIGATSSIATEAGAQTAVSALANAVAALGNAQAAVGRGENQFTYATNLAQSELTNETAAESGIRDADLAAQAANLTKAQILLQAGVAALAQANAAPQNILALLKS